MTRLADRACNACRGASEPLRGERLAELAVQVPEWDVEGEHHISRTFKFPNFLTALAFVNRVGDLAEREAHHPDIHLSWGKVKAELWTHKVGGLTDSDFILAAKSDQLPTD